MFDKEELALRTVVIKSMGKNQIEELHEIELKNKGKMTSGEITRYFQTDHLTKIISNIQYEFFENEMNNVFYDIEKSLIKQKNEIPSFLESMHSFDWQVWNTITESYNLDAVYFRDLQRNKRNIKYSKGKTHHVYGNTD